MLIVKPKNKIQMNIMHPCLHVGKESSNQGGQVDHVGGPVPAEDSLSLRLT